MADTEPPIPWDFYINSLQDLISEGVPFTSGPTYQVTEVINPMPNILIQNQIANEIVIPADIFSGLQKSIQDAITASTKSVSDIANAAFGKIGDFVKNIGDLLWQGIKGLASWISTNIGDFVKSLASEIWDVIKKVASTIGDWITQAVGVLKEVARDVAITIDDLASLVKNINDQLVKPLTDAVNGTIKTIATLTVAIEKDLHEGLAGIMKIPGDVSAGLTSLDSTLGRTVQQLGIVNEQTYAKILDPKNPTVFSAGFEGLTSALGKLGGGAGLQTTYEDLTHLPTEADTGAITDYLANLIKEIEESDSLWSKVLKVLLDAVLSLNFILVSLEQKKEAYAEAARKALPNTKLDPATALEAWQREFISDSDLSEELAVKGFDGARIEVMKSLQTFLVDPATALDWFYRGIIGDRDLRDNLGQHGIFGDQVDAFITGTLNPFPPDLASELYVRGLIDDNTLNTLWSSVRLGDKERTARFNTLLKLTGVTDEIRNNARHAMTTGGFGVGSYSSQAPQEILDAGKRDRLDQSVVNSLWRQHWYVPSVAEAIAVYFRGLRTRTELDAILDAHGIPPEIKDELVESQRTLIPYRTVPAMLKAGVLSEERATAILQAHGYTLEDALALIKYAETGSKTTKADTAAATHEASLATCKELYVDGAITEDQYRVLLAEHGYDSEGVDLEVTATNLVQAAKDRKATAQGVVDEASLGMITIDEAQNQLAQYNFTVAEQAKYLKSIRSALKTSSKVPSEAELYKMLANSLITSAEYLDAMKINGFSDVWANRFLAIRTGST